MFAKLLQLSAMVAIGLPAAAQPPQDLQAHAKAKWLVDYAEDRCLASHAYQVGDQEWIVAIEPRPTTTESSVMIVAPAQAGTFEQARLFAAGVPISRPGMSLESVDASGRRLFGAALSRAEYARLLSTGSLRVENQGRSVAFALDQASAIREQLDSCVQDLLATWGLAAEQQANLASFPVTERAPDSYVRSEDAATVAPKIGASGKTTVLVQVGSDGRAQECTVIQSSGDADHDVKTCRIFVDRARFRPARDRAGKAVDAPYVASIRWTKA
jgi:Gram-negative bacterial TonB protein C-terminal